LSNKDVLVFEIEQAKGKPRDVEKKKKKDYCPFCDTKNLTNIIEQKNDMIWLENKFKTLKDTNQTLVIESSDHYGDISNYSVEKNQEVFEFIYHCWNEMIQSKKYESVLMYKNFGPMSGGSLRHPHFQIIGLDKVDGYKHVEEENFTGMDVFNSKHINVNVSQKPIMGFVEFNVVINNPKYIDDLAEFTRVTVKYVLDDLYGGKFDSYNIFFYKFGKKIICKIEARYVVSPYFVGYRLSQRDGDKQVRGIADVLLKRLQENAQSDEIK
jgi:ATP adenylyltransferase/5',5'''-P-1,P-4-tetraphosphate phosphorylase II